MRQILRRTLLATLSLLLACGPGRAGAALPSTGNLLVNGDAELHRCTDDWTAQTPVPAWQVLRGAASVLCYSAFDHARETLNVPSPALAGQALFAAPGADTAMEQTVDVSAARQGIDHGAVRFALSGWLGGWRDRPEQATLTAVFTDAQGAATGAPVLLAGAGAADRQHTTALLARAVHGVVPAGTRRIVVTVSFESGMTSYHNAYADALQLTLQGEVGTLRPSTARVPPAGIPALDHVYVVMMENTNYADVIHGEPSSARIDPRMPFLAGVARRGALLGNMWANYHPSDENYVAMVAGDTFRYGSVYFPDYHLSVDHLGDRIDAAGKRWQAYVQHMNTPCNLQSDPTGSGNYAPDDQPFVHFANVIDDLPRCIATTRDLQEFTTAVARHTLPDFAWIAADGWWDGEGAWWDQTDVGVSLARQDAFLQATFAPLLASADWRNSRSLLVITWDESLGWGWPDNRVPTVLVGAPGLLREGAQVATHYDGYSVLRTIEAGLGLAGLDRFDTWANPLREAFADGEDAAISAPVDLQASERATARGALRDTFGRVATPAAVTRGERLTLLVPGEHSAELRVSLAPAGQVPASEAPSWPVDRASGRVAIPTEALRPGSYGAWLRHGEAPPHRAGVPLIVLPAQVLSAQRPGVAIVGAAPGSEAPASLEIREASNLIVHYCRPPDLDASAAWIGIFPVGTPAAQQTQDNANALGFWLRAAGAAPGSACGEQMAFSAELTPGQDYLIQLFRQAADGSADPVGEAASFHLTPALP